MRWVLKSTATSPNITETNKKLITTKSKGVNLANLMAVQFTNYLLVKNIRRFLKDSCEESFLPSKIAQSY